MAKKMYQRQTKAKSLGQTLNGILIGLVLGAIIIAILLWFLNKQKMPTEPPQSSQPIETEIIVPNKAVLPDSSTVLQTDETDGSSGVVDDLDTDVDEKDASDDEHNKQEIVKPSTSTPANVSKLNQDKRPVEKQTPSKDAQTVKKDSNKPSKSEQTTSPKPTAEQILEHGSVEKARAAAKQTESVAKKEATTAGRQVRLQAGSFATAEQAESQRAKLALLGITAKVESAQVNGKTVHRVRTASLSQDKAAQVRKQLSNNGIDSIAVGASK